MVAQVRKDAVKFGGWIEGGSKVSTTAYYNSKVVIVGGSEPESKAFDNHDLIVLAKAENARFACGLRNLHQKAIMCGVGKRLASRAIIDDDYFLSCERG